MDAFEILGVDRDADTRELRVAYRQAAKAEHPDTGGDTDRFIRIQDAYRSAQAQRAAARPRSASLDWLLDRDRPAPNPAPHPGRHMLAEIAYRFELGRPGSSPKSFIAAIDAELFAGETPVDLPDRAVEVISYLIASGVDIPVVVATIVNKIDKYRNSG
ncbi:MAG: J domain-containing protein [Actinomycetia bacterium]|nr:J domain-containing protein [Actinomycetes bacterium]